MKLVAAPASMPALTFAASSASAASGNAIAAICSLLLFLCLSVVDQEGNQSSTSWWFSLYL
jgi:hypothetical protein